ncbi:segregation and condensation protein A [Arenicella chitinivorans]|uniref:Segregation and condensation protein A n=1 Tax=Arenicella chitinivorans TaxID=1329800 RepID=A0A918RHK7_9GAMM|nr:segregation/condensation protein A [Arenicella chitinivorans]GGZ99169.1 segregation and condensation protein A [Arenicella chitinivorans]
MSNQDPQNPTSGSTEQPLGSESAQQAPSPQAEKAQVQMYTESMRAVVMGEVMREWPQDLFIPPDALEVVLESFEGPLDLLLYLIRKQNLDILNIPVADITRQYMTYVEIMRAANLDLAAEYLVMAALLGEIKSRMLLPRPKAEEEDEEDPMAALVRRLQEYERFSQAANELDDRPRLERDIFASQAVFDDPNPPEVKAEVSLEQLVKAFQAVVERADANQHMKVSRDMLSMRERMTNILSRLQNQDYLRFEELFTHAEGRLGVVVTFIALLELFRDDMLVVVQTEPLAPIHIKRAA